MSLSSDAGDEAVEVLRGQEAGQKAEATFYGDTGELRLDSRRVLVQLLQGPSVDGRRQGKLWAVLQRDEAILKSRLHDLFLELVVDWDQKVAFTRQVLDEGLDAPILLRSATLTFIESALVLYLRQILTSSDDQNERAVTSLGDMTEHLGVYERSNNVDRARFAKQVRASIEKAKKLGLLRKLHGNDDRFEVSPTLKLLFSAEEIEALGKSYLALSQQVAATVDGDRGDPTSDDEAPLDEIDDLDDDHVEVRR